MFTDAEFMTGKDKELVLKNWNTFLKYGLKKEHFTKRLYEHLHLHSGYIAHFSRHGFYSTYFEAGQDILRFFDRFCNYKVIADYEDLNTAMRQAYSKYKDAIKKQAEDDITDRLNQVEAYVKRAKTDREFTKKFLERVRI